METSALELMIVFLGFAVLLLIATGLFLAVKLVLARKEREREETRAEENARLLGLAKRHIWVLEQTIKEAEMPIQEIEL